MPARGTRETSELEAEPDPEQAARRVVEAGIGRRRNGAVTRRVGRILVEHVLHVQIQFRALQPRRLQLVADLEIPIGLRLDVLQVDRGWSLGVVIATGTNEADLVEDVEAALVEICLRIEPPMRIGADPDFASPVDRR